MKSSEELLEWVVDIIQDIFRRPLKYATAPNELEIHLWCYTGVWAHIVDRIGALSTYQDQVSKELGTYPGGLADCFSKANPTASESEGRDFVLQKYKSMVEKLGVFQTPNVAVKSSEELLEWVVDIFQNIFRRPQTYANAPNELEIHLWCYMAVWAAIGDRIDEVFAHHDHMSRLLGTHPGGLADCFSKSHPTASESEGRDFVLQHYKSMVDKFGVFPNQHYPRLAGMLHQLFRGDNALAPLPEKQWKWPYHTDSLDLEQMAASLTQRERDTLISAHLDIKEIVKIKGCRQLASFIDQVCNGHLTHNFAETTTLTKK